MRPTILLGILLTLTSAAALAQAVALCPNQSGQNCTTLMLNDIVRQQELQSTIATRTTPDEARNIAKEETAKAISTWDSKAIDEAIYPQLREKLFDDLIKKIANDPVFLAKIKQIEDTRDTVAEQRIKDDPKFRKRMKDAIGKAEQATTSASTSPTPPTAKK